VTVGDWISLVVAIATVVMAGATYYLAWVTRRLAKETADAAQQAEQHHRENRRPFCVITFQGVDLHHPFGNAFRPSANFGLSIRIKGELQNKGGGPATDVYVYLSQRRGGSDDCPYRLTQSVLVSGLVGPGDSVKIEIPIEESNISQGWDPKSQRSITIGVLNFIADDTDEVVLEYKDVFGKFYHTIHPRGIQPRGQPGSEDREAQAAVRPDKPAPIFRTGRQPVRTLADAPRDSLLDP